MRYAALGLLVLVTLAVSGNAGVDGPQRAVIEPVKTVPGCKAQRWESYEVDEPVTVTRRVKKWRLVEYSIPIPDPGPQPADVVISEPVVVQQPAAQQPVVVQQPVDCVECEQIVQSTAVPVDGGLPAVQVGVIRNQQMDCQNGQCVQQQGGIRQRGGILRRILGR
jgi:hypothetical protein